MNLVNALYQLGVREDTLSQEEKQQLDKDGFLPLYDVLNAKQVIVFKNLFNFKIQTTIVQK